MITHVAPATLEARPNLLKLSESACLKELVIAQGQALERKPSNAWARKIPALNRPKNAVTVSIIAKSFAPPHEHNATTPRTVKRIPGLDRRSGRSDALAQQFLAEPGACRGLCNAGARTRASLEHASARGSAAMARQPLIHHADALPISAAFRMRYLHDLVRRWAASRRMTGERRQVGA
jgi:hypothetical protein